MRHYKLFPIFIVSIFFINGCRPKYRPTPVFTITNDFENVIGWSSAPSNNSNTVLNTDGHSGNCSYKVDKTSNFGYFYKRKFKEITDKKIFWVRISGYCKAKSDYLNKASVVCAVQDVKEQYLLWGEEYLQGHVNGRKDKWLYFEKSFNVSATYSPEAIFSTFVWTTDQSDELLIDDFKIEFFD